MKVIKLIWLADRYHLRKYGRPIVNDEYWAMSFGPVGSSVKDIAESSSFLADEERNYSQQFIKNVDNNTVRSAADIDLDVFSETDLEALSFIYENFGNFDQYELADLSHKYPEWKKFEDKLEINTRELMSYINFFDVAEESLYDKKFPISQEQADKSREIFKEDYEIANAWI